MQENPKDRPAEAPDSANELQGRVDKLKKTYGVPLPLADSMDQKALEQKLFEISADSTCRDFSELLTFNELLYRKNALQREAAMNRPGSQVDRAEFITTNQGETYFKYMRQILSHTIQTMDNYLTLRRNLPSIPTEIQQLESDIGNFSIELERVLQERLDFGNAALAQNLLMVQRNRRGEVMQNQQTLMNQLEALKKNMDAAGKAAITQQDRIAIRIHSNALDQKIIELVANKGHLPSELLLSLQGERYRIVLEQQKSLVRDKGLAKERIEWENLRAKNARVREGKGEALTEEEGKRFLELQELVNRNIPGYKTLSDERRALTDEIVHTTENLSEYHEQAQELLIVQSQFKTSDDLGGATPPNPDDTPALVRQKIDQVTQQRANFHRERLSDFVNNFEEEVLVIGFPERVEDFSNKSGREFVRTISNQISSLVTLPAPKTAGIRDFLRRRFAGPLNDAVGWPIEKMDKKFEELEPSEQQEVMRKAKSIADAVREFDRNKLRNVQNALGVIQSLPPAKQALGEAPKDPLPELPQGGLTSDNVQEFIKEHGLPTAYALAIQQLDGAMGDPESGFIGEVKIFTDKINDVVDIHLETADALYKQSTEWKRWMYALLAAALGGAAAMYLAPKILRATWRTTVPYLKKAPGVAKKGISNLWKNVRLQEHPMRVVTVAIILIAAKKLSDNLHRDARLEELPEVEAVRAAAELMELKGNKKAPTYQIELECLHNRLQAMEVRHGAEMALHRLEKLKGKTGGEHANLEQIHALQERCFQLEKSARRLHRHYYDSFPITRSLKTDPAREKGNVGFDIRDIDQARTDGYEYRQSSNPLLNLSRLDQKPPKKVPNIPDFDQPFLLQDHQLELLQSSYDEVLKQIDTLEQILNQ